MKLDIDYLDGFKLAIQNSKRLSNIADKSAQENEFGIACSLNILSIEEAIKACFLLIKHYNPHDQIQDFDKIFKYHKVKHEHLEKFAFVFKVEFLQLKSLIGELNKTLYLFQDIVDRAKIKVTVEDYFSQFLDTKAWVDKLSNDEIDLKNIVKWLKTANDLKNNGFYVGLAQDQVWKSPSIISENEYRESKQHTITMIKHIESFEMIYAEVSKFTKVAAK
jgi:AbiV family abortive infection protein